MNDVLYELMDWAAIESLVYSEEDDPHRILGPHKTEKGVLIQAFIPEAQHMSVIADGEEFPMTCMDENGFYAALLKDQEVPDYTLLITYEDGRTLETGDPYRYGQILPEQELIRFDAGICYRIYDYLGAHPCEVSGVKGVLFAVNMTLHKPVIRRN